MPVEAAVSSVVLPGGSSPVDPLDPSPPEVSSPPLLDPDDPPVDSPPPTGAPKR